MINSLPPVCSHAIRAILMVWVRITLGFQPCVIRTQTINIFSYCMNKQGITNNIIQLYQTSQWHELYYRCSSPLEWTPCFSTWIAFLAYVQAAAENSLVSIIFVLDFLLCFIFCKVLCSLWGRYINAFVIITIVIITYNIADGNDGC